MQTALQEVSTNAPDANGNISFTFGPVKRSRVWVGSILITSSSGLPITSSTIAPVLWEAKDSGNTIAKWYNDLPSMTMQARNQVTITGSNIANTEQLQAHFYGVQTDLSDTPIVWPSPPPAPPASVPKVIVSNNLPLPAGTNQIGSNQPVVIGTSVEIFECIVAPFNLGVGKCRLAIQWSVDGSFVDPIEWNITLDMNTTMRGLILPNLAQFIRFLAISTGGIQISLTALTGLPPIVRPPIIAGGVLWHSFPPVGNSAVALPPYVGSVNMQMAPNNTAGFGVSIQSSDINGVVQTNIRHEQGWPAGTGPFVSSRILYVPPLINVLQIAAAPAGAETTGIVIGP